MIMIRIKKEETTRVLAVVDLDSPMNIILERMLVVGHHYHHDTLLFSMIFYYHITC